MEDGAPPWAAISSISLWSEVGEQRLLDELKDGVDVTAKDTNGRTLLHWTAECNGRTGVIELLLEHGADDHARDNSGATPLHRAAAGNDAVRVVELFLDRGAVVNTGTDLGATPLHWVAGYNTKDIVDLLLNRGAG